MEEVLQLSTRRVGGYVHSLAVYAGSRTGDLAYKTIGKPTGWYTLCSFCPYKVARDYGLYLKFLGVMPPRCNPNSFCAYCGAVRRPLRLIHGRGKERQYGGKHGNNQLTK